ncbi:NfeD family protein [Oceanicola sp. S124]|uniref:NfeD family protein n=1 Tax=Oceanicola sp. S124 TaxID=1042378 RepID=UPI00025590CB|nr:hypothetical protein [Oceanicola sp. S124]
MLLLWWAWMAAGVVLLALEMLVPGFLFLGFALGALVVGALLLVGVTVALSWMLLLFALLSLIAWAVLRRVMGVRKGQVKMWDRDINED